MNKKRMISFSIFILLIFFCKGKGDMEGSIDPVEILLNKTWMMKHSEGKERFDSDSLTGESFKFKKKNNIYKVWLDLSGDDLFLTEYQKVELTKDGTIKFSDPFEKKNVDLVLEIKMIDEATFKIIKPEYFQKNFKGSYYVEYPFYAKEAYENIEKKLPGR